MPARSDVTLKDGQTPSVSHTFKPGLVVDTRSESSAEFEDRSGGIAIGNPRLRLALKRPNEQSPNHRFGSKIVVPVLDTVWSSDPQGYQPAPKWAFDNLFSVDFVMNQRSTAQQRKDMLAYLREWVNSPLFEAVALNQDMPY